MVGSGAVAPAGRATDSTAGLENNLQTCSSDSISSVGPTGFEPDDVSPPPPKGVVRRLRPTGFDRRVRRVGYRALSWVKPMVARLPHEPSECLWIPLYFDRHRMTIQA